MTRLAVLVACLLVGCIKPQLLSCGDKLCSIDSVCLPNGECATQESVDVCMGLAEGAACTTSLFTGACIGGVCKSSRCGDGVVSGSEQCDGAVTGVDCVEYGFDTGIPACSELCAYDVVGSCVRFGWQRVLPASAGILWTNGTLFAVLSVDGALLEIYENGQVVQSLSAGTEPFTSVAGSGSTIIANTYTRIVKSEAGGPFTDVSTSGLPQVYAQLALGDDGTIYAGAFVTDHYEIYAAKADTFSQIYVTQFPQTGRGIRFTGGALYAMFSDGVVKRYAGNAWSPPVITATDSVIDLVDVGGVLYAAVANVGAFKYTATAQTLLAPGSFTSVAGTPSGIYFGAADTIVLRFQADSVTAFNTPIYGTLASDGTNAYTFGSGIYRFTGTAWSVHDGTSQPAKDIAVLSKGAVVIATVSELYTDRDLYGWDRFSTASYSPNAIAGRTPVDMYVSMGTSLQQYDGTKLTAVPLPAGAMINDLAWDDATNTLYAVGPQGLSMKYKAAWTKFTDIAGCDLDAIATTTATIYAAGSCGTEGVVWSLAGSSWTELHRSSVPFVSLWVDDSDNLYAAGPSGGIVRANGTWRDEPAAKGVSISATSPNDIWVGGGPGDLLHWDGLVWARVAIIGPASPHVIATKSTVYVGGAKQAFLLR